MSVMPWPDLIRAAAIIGVSPSAFWALSVREWRAVMGKNDAQALAPAQLKDLIAAFPDETGDVT